MSDVELAQSLEVGRQTVREAFIKLAEVGLLEVRPQRGTFVSKISLRKVTAVRFVREAVETEIARQAAGEITEAGLGRMRELLRQQEECPPEQTGRFIELDDAFHRVMAEAADALDAWNIVESHKVQVDRVRHLGLRLHSTGSVLVQHRAVLEAMASGDADQADAAMRKHLTHLTTSLPKVHREHPEFFEP